MGGDDTGGMAAGKKSLSLRPEGPGRAPLRVPVGGDDPVHLALTLVPLQGLEEGAVPAGGHGPSPHVSSTLGTVNFTWAVTLFPCIWIW
jgi:hypothetical protein